MYYVIFDAGNTNRIASVSGSALKAEADERLGKLKNLACGTSSDFKMAESREIWSVGETFVPDTGK